MHVEPLEKLPRSVREFLSHYAMIVLSILTALALEQVALRMEHRHEGARAREEIEQEIASNQQQVHASLKATEENAQAWQAVFKRALAEVRDGSSTNESRIAALRQAGSLFRDSVPSLKTTAWDAAISDHSVNYLDHDDLTRYSQIYALQRSFSQAMWDTLRDSAARDVSQISLYLSLERAGADQTIATLNSRLRTIAIIESQLGQVDAALRGGDAPEESHAETARAAAAGTASAAAASH